MKKKWKIVWGAAVVLLVAAFVVTQALQGVEVEVIKVAPRDIARSFSEEGVVKSQEEYTVYSLDRGRVKALPVAEGDRVDEGDLLIALEDEEVSYALAQLEARLEGLAGEELKLTEEPGSAEVERLQLGIVQAQRGLAAAAKKYERVQSLYENEAVSLVELEEAENMLEEAEHHLAEQEKALEVLYESYEAPKGSREIIEAQRSALLSQINLYQYKKDNYRIHAPFTGTVGQIEAEEKEMVGPQAPIMSLFQEEDYLVEARILTRDIYAISEGMAVDLVLERREQDVRFTGEVIAISPYAQDSLSPLGLEEERVKVTILPDVPEDLKIKPGYRLEVEFSTAAQAEALAVPNSALFSYNGEDALLVVEDGRANVRTVITGLETRRDVVIADGLQEGDLVILDPQDKGLTEGARVSYFIINEGE